MADLSFANRPVFTFRPQYVDPTETSSDDGTRDQVGFGVVTPWRVQSYSQRIFRMKFLLERDEIRELEAFFDARRGQFEGFWLPTWNGDFRLAQPVGAASSIVQIEPSGFPAFFSVHPGNAYVAFILPKTGGIMPCQVTGAVSQPPYEELHLAGAAGFDGQVESTLVSNLVYVRFNSDEMAFSYVTDSLAEVEVEFIELPTEYAAVEAGERPAWLYEIIQGSSFWLWTSHGDAITTGGIYTWNPADITHTQIKKSTNCFDEGVSLKIGLRNRDNPFYQFLSGPPAVPVRVNIYKTLLTNLSDWNLIYGAYVNSVSFNARGVVEASLSSVLGVAEARVPRVLVQGMCNWQLYDASTCRVNEAARRIYGTVSATDTTWIESPAFAVGNNYLALGRAVFGSETRLIIAHSGSRITLNAAFRANLAVGAQVMALPGCDKNQSTCQAKFGNGINFGGFPCVPLKNPAMEALNPPSTTNSGSKK